MKIEFSLVSGVDSEGSWLVEFSLAGGKQEIGGLF
jgi:hypothetical protein